MDDITSGTTGNDSNNGQLLCIIALILIGVLSYAVYEMSSGLKTLGVDLAVAKTENRTYKAQVEALEATIAEIKYSKVLDNEKPTPKKAISAREKSRLIKEGLWNSYQNLSKAEAQYFEVIRNLKLKVPVYYIDLKEEK